jgi:hypothetical protein
MNNKTIAIMAIATIAALMVAGVSFTTDHVYATKKKTQTIAQANACGNGPLPLNVFCQNAASQVQGKDNSVSVSTSQP